jgi:uncharacterized protein YjbI with pentapeptide repeats
MSGMTGYRDSLGDNSYTRESFIEKFMSDPSTKSFMWEKLRGLDLSNLELLRGGGYGIELRGADFTGTNFSRSIMRCAYLVEAILWHVNFTHCDLRDAVFYKSDIRGADFSGAKLRGASFHEAVYDHQTKFPVFFNVEKREMIRK